MTDRLNATDLGHIELLLKRDMARKMGSVQEDRIAGPAGSMNVGTARDYVEQARALRKILKIRGRQGYVPVREMHGGPKWVDDEVIDAAGIEKFDELADVLRKLHSIKNPNLPLQTHSTHTSVPGNTE